jgi:phosphoglycerate dehydrogenase-like enzyme
MCCAFTGKTRNIARCRRRKEWLELSAPSAAERRIGILGIGELGSAAARVADLPRFPGRSGWSRSAKTLPGAGEFHGGRWADGDGGAERIS